MRISDWSSDVCSSDLNGRCVADRAHAGVVRGSGGRSQSTLDSAAGVRETARRVARWTRYSGRDTLVDLSRIQPSGAAGADTEARHTDGAVQVLRDSCAAEAAAGANARGSTVMPNLQNKIAIVTGAARGQGAAQARRLVEDGRSEEHTSDSSH